MKTPANASSDAQHFGDADPAISHNRVFFAIQRIQRRLLPGIEKELRQMGIADPIWYEILLATEEAGEAGVQMMALEKRLFVPQYAISRHVARLEKAGLIRRTAASGVGRGQILHLTEAGRGLPDRIWRVYEPLIQQAFAPAISTDDAYALLRLLNRLYR